MSATEDRIIDIQTLEPPARDRSLTTVEVPPDETPPPGGAWLIVLGVGLAILWIAGCAAYVVGYAGLSALAASTPAQIGGLAFVAFGPALFVLMAGIAARQMVRFSAEARVMTRAANRLTRPERLVEEETRNLSTVLVAEVARVNTGMDAALARLGAMEEVIRHHADSLAVAATKAGEQSRSLIDDLRAEREALTALADVLDTKAKMIADAIGEQSRMVARAAELAEGAALEGKHRIEAGVAALHEASDAVLTGSDKAAETLQAQRQKLDALAATFAEQGQALTRLYDTHRDEIGEASRTLREEQKRIASALDFHRAELGELVKVAGAGAEEISAATRAGGETLRKAVDEALGQARQLGDMVLSRTESMAERQSARLAALDDAAVRARAASEAATAAMDAQAAAIQARVEQLGESTFEAADRAERVFERRLDEASRAVERVARLADDADAALAARFERSLETWRNQLAEVERRIDAVGENLGQVPDAARERVTELETSVRRGIENLRAAARSAADEAREIDSALQARMRHNYELLSEFVLRIGAVSDRVRPAPELPRREERAAREPASDLTREAPRQPASTFESGLSWRDIVSGLRESEDGPRTPRRPADEDQRIEVRKDTAEALGADPSALTPAAARDAAHARRSAGIDAMRETIREHAREHVALLARTIERDDALRARVRRLVDTTEDVVSAAAREDRPDRLIEILSSTAGRGYLLLSAALGGA